MFFPQIPIYQYLQNKTNLDVRNLRSKYFLIHPRLLSPGVQHIFSFFSAVGEDGEQQTHEGLLHGQHIERQDLPHQLVISLGVGLVFFHVLLLLTVCTR